MDIRLAAVLVCCLWPGGGCELIMVGDPVQEMDLTSQDDAEENLKAIRAILEDQASRRPEQKPAGSSLQPSSPDAAPSLTEPSSGMRPLPSPSSSTGKPHVTAKLPWTPTAPDLPAVPDRPVPAYTIPAPVGPDYSGTIRCTPDGMGGQRCAGR
jgi:hypothetical protein